MPCASFKKFVPHPFWSQLVRHADPRTPHRSTRVSARAWRVEETNVNTRSCGPRTVQKHLSRGEPSRLGSPSGVDRPPQTLPCFPQKAHFFLAPAQSCGGDTSIECWKGCQPGGPRSWATRGTGRPERRGSDRGTSITVGAPCPWWLLKKQIARYSYQRPCCQC